jgi:hypothetical protein
MHVERDYAGLRIAAREYFEEGWAFRKAERTLMLNRVNDPAGFMAKSLPRRSLAHGYYEWIGYLAWLSSMHELVRFRDLLVMEAEGILIVRRARDEFMGKKMHCGKCGGLNEKIAICCAECGVKFRD